MGLVDLLRIALCVILGRFHRVGFAMEASGRDGATFCTQDGALSPFHHRSSFDLSDLVRYRLQRRYKNSSSSLL
jgi:hypothetical protein